MISIITPFYQSAAYIGDAINSVLNQQYEDWELILINDGSTDASKEIALSFYDNRIKYLEQDNKGVSAARNLGLKQMKGDFFCFLDADDVLPVRSLESRYILLKNHPFLSFVDGRVQKFDQNMDVLLQIWQPNLTDNLLRDLVKLTGNSFFSPTWMIRKQKNRNYQFRTCLSHGEDLFFFMELARTNGSYAITNETILNYRDSPNSAMKNLIGLENGYRFIESQIKNWRELSNKDLSTFRFRYKRAMFLAYLKELNFGNAIKVWF